MDRSQKSDEAFGQSQSSSSRRVMWKLSDEEETFDSIVNYRRLPARSVSTAAQQQPQPQQQQPQQQQLPISSCDLPKPSASSSSSFAADAWHQIYKLIRTNKLAEELSATPSLALRYKPSRESLKYRRSKDLAAEKAQQQAQPQPAISKVPHRVIITDLKMESCCLPPQQTAVVREVAPKFAQRIPNDTDSCCSADLEAPRNTPVLNISNVSSVASHLQTPVFQRVVTGPNGEMISVTLKTPAASLGPRTSASSASHSTTITNKATTATKLSGGGTAAAANKRRTTGQTNSRSTNSAKSHGNVASNRASSSNASFPTFRQRQLELHRYRVQVEERRLNLLELKIAREREETLHNEILFHKDLQLRERQFKCCDDNSSA